MTKGRSDGGQNNRLLSSVCIVALFLIFLYVFCGSNNGSESALEYGSRSLRKLGSSYLSDDEDSDIG
ncbi:probable methyltransferase PMT3, partial [Olea europaea subsp. europaea]